MMIVTQADGTGCVLIVNSANKLFMDARQSIRNEVRNKRRNLSVKDRKRYAQQFARYFSRQWLFLKSRRIAFYISNDGELDLLPLIKTAWQLNKQCFLPVLKHTFSSKLLFAPYTESSKMLPNCFNIPEPIVTPRQLIQPNQLDLVLTPLVAFDKSGNRIGMGGGYYDRSFSYLNHRCVWYKPKLVGVAYDFQEWPVIASQSWDVRLHSVVCARL